MAEIFISASQRKIEDSHSYARNTEFDIYFFSQSLSYFGSLFLNSQDRIYIYIVKHRTEKLYRTEKL